ncbi:MAG: hypothetical protein M0R74_06140 [Dehalococcoidia bacterium]|nr:hypothetical protein [Dehalococcoidia bacterium]
METKRFIGSDMRRLYERVRAEFGPDAIIVRTRSLMRDGAEPLIELLAAPPNAEPGLSLDLQRTMVDGVLGYLHGLEERCTVGDLEDLAARESLEPPVDLSDPVPVESVPAPEQEWFAGFVAKEAPASPRTIGGFDEARRIPFGGLDEIEDEAPPSHDWAMRTRPRPIGDVARPLPAIIDFASDRDPVVAELRAAGLSQRAAERVRQAAPQEGDALQCLVAALGALEVRYPEELQTALVTIQGPAGAGRTTALMRMALDCADAGREALLVAADTNRSRDQLHAHAEATGLPVADATDPSQIANLAARSRRGTCLFVDVPAGPWKPPRGLSSAHHAYLALPAHWQREALEAQVREYVARRLSGCVITGADLATDLTPVFSLAVQSGLGVAFLSSGRDISTGIETLEPLELASGILRGTSGDRTNGRLITSA